MTSIGNNRHPFRTRSRTFFLPLLGSKKELPEQRNPDLQYLRTRLRCHCNLECRALFLIRRVKMVLGRLKKIIYNANHRGMKETDVLLGKFASACFVQMDSKQQDVFIQLLEELDADILSWCLGRSTPKPIYQPLITEILAFHNQQS